MKPLLRATTVDSVPDAGVAEAPEPGAKPSLLQRVKRMLGIDTAQGKYAYGNDPRFGYLSESRIADTWTRTSGGSGVVGCGVLFGVGVV